MKPASLITLALRGGEAMSRSRTPTTLGVRFPERDATGLAGSYGHSLYDGVSGVGIAVMDLARATGESRFFDLADEINDGLIESIPTEGPLRPGLFSGDAGVALFHLARAHLLADRESLNRAVELGLRLGQSSFTDTDIISGAAGAGILQLTLYRATRDRQFLEGARRAARFLEETATTVGNGLAWPTRDPRQPLPNSDSAADPYAGTAPHLQTGLAHGTAGICLFLVDLAATGEAPDAMALAERGFRWLRDQAISVGDGLVWPRSDSDPTPRTHWCHGSVGVAHAYLALHSYSARPHALVMAIAAGEAAWNDVRRQRDEPSYHFHGMSGAIELFTALFECGAGATWRRRAMTIVQRLAERATTRPVTSAGNGRRRDAASANALCPFGGTGVGLSLGTAGIVRALLRAAGHDVFSIWSVGREKTAAAPRSAARSATPANGVTPKRRRAGFASTAHSVGNGDAANLLPRVAARLASGNRLVVLGAPDADVAHKTIRALRDAPAGAAYFESLCAIESACVDLESRFQSVLAPSALAPRTLGVLLREIGGLSLSPLSQPHTVAHAARRMTRHSLDALEAALTHVAHDTRSSLTGVVSGRLTSIVATGSDPHRRGRRAFKLQFEEGPALIYKARSVAVDREIAGTTRSQTSITLADRTRGWLAPSVSGGRLPTHRLIDAGPWHGYAEQVLCDEGWSVEPDVALASSALHASAPLPTITRLTHDDERRFWYSAGLLAGHAFSLGVQDLHLENVVCGRSDGAPALAAHAVDLEVAFGAVDGLTDTLLVDMAPFGDGNANGHHASSHSHAALASSLSFVCNAGSEDWALEITGDGAIPVARSRQAVDWSFAHAAQNSDGSFGYGAQLCAFIRGMADQWTLLRDHAGEVGDHLRATLMGKPARVVAKMTSSYANTLSRMKSGRPPIAGAALEGDVSHALPFAVAESEQLAAFDFPYFFRYLRDPGTSPDGIYWLRGPRCNVARAPELEVLPRHSPFWTIVERQSDCERFARAMVDAVRFVAPSGSFERHDPALGVRVVRKNGDERLWIVVLLGERRDERFTCRVTPAGRVEWWLD